MTFKADYSALIFFYFFKKTIDFLFLLCYNIIVPKGRAPKNLRTCEEANISLANINNNVCW